MKAQKSVPFNFRIMYFGNNSKCLDFSVHMQTNEPYLCNYEMIYFCISAPK